MTLYVDSSALYAALDRSDHGHERMTRALGGGEALVASDHVLVEAWHLTRIRLGRYVADRLWESARDGAFEIEVVSSGDLDAAWAIRIAFPDQDFSIVDLSSFAVMERLGLHRVATLGDDFAVYRFGARRDRAFELVR